MGSLGPTTVSVHTASSVDSGLHQPGRKENGSGGGGGGWWCGVLGCGFRVPLHYPRYKKADYEEMPEWRVDCLLREYGLPLPADGDLDGKRRFAMGAFLWPGDY